MFYSCDEEEVISRNPNDQLGFSIDTLRFDTVFTERGSATRWFKVYNPNDETLIIDQVSIASGDSRFRFNVDGFQGPVVSELEIAPNDSTYVFMEVLIDPDEPLSSSPFVIEDQIVFERLGSEQYVSLEAWGQNANYIPSVNQKNSISLISCNNQTITFDDTRPYVFFGAVVLDSCALEIAAGTQIYMHGGFGVTEDFVFNGGLFVIGSQGRLTCNGSVDDPIVWQSDRIEDAFATQAGQWSGIRFSKNSKGNSINHTIIKHPIFGIELDSAAELSMNASQILHTSIYGVLGIEALLDATNCIIGDTDGSALRIVQGGTYHLDHCTLDARGTEGQALNFTNYRCIDLGNNCDVVQGGDLLLQVRNSILNASSNDAVVLDELEDVQMDYRIYSSLLKYDEIIEFFPDFESHLDQCRKLDRIDLLFKDIAEGDYELDSLSVARDYCQPIGVEFDILNQLRDASPDAGAYERLD